jgi:hypothetical protein
MFGAAAVAAAFVGCADATDTAEPESPDETVADEVRVARCPTRIAVALGDIMLPGPTEAALRGRREATINSIRDVAVASALLRDVVVGGPRVPAPPGRPTGARCYYQLAGSSIPTETVFRSQNGRDFLEASIDVGARGATLRAYINVMPNYSTEGLTLVAGQRPRLAAVVEGAEHHNTIVTIGSASATVIPAAPAPAPGS